MLSERIAGNSLKMFLNVVRLNKSIQLHTNLFLGLLKKRSLKEQFLSTKKWLFIWRQSTMRLPKDEATKVILLISQ